MMIVTRSRLSFDLCRCSGQNIGLGFKPWTPPPLCKKSSVLVPPNVFARPILFHQPSYPDDQVLDNYTINFTKIHLKAYIFVILRIIYFIGEICFWCILLKFTRSCMAYCSSRFLLIMFPFVLPNRAAYLWCRGRNRI